MEKIVSLCKRRGFVFQSSEIYGGLNGCWDYGPLGVELKRNLKDYWWRVMVRERDDIVGMDGAILQNRAVWKASGHEETFTDPMVDCRTCKARLRADQLPQKEGVPYCSVCGSRDLTEARAFNLMFVTYVGATQDESSKTYLRPETAQAIFVQFKNVLEVSRKKLPFGIAQIGKAFRNEINPRNFTFRSREFEQMELEYFCAPEQGRELLEYWLKERLRFYENIGLPREKLHVHEIPADERAFYSQGTYDLEYEFPFGVQELEGIAHRGNYDLKQHQEHSGKPLEYFCAPEQGRELLEYWLKERLRFYENIGLPREKLHVHEIPAEERAFYSQGTYDIEFEFPFGIQELEGVAYRTDYDLTQHIKASGKPLDYFDEETKQRFIPHVVEPSAGVDRTALALICSAYDEETVTDEKGKTETRIVLRFHPRIAPVKAGIFPLLKNNEHLVAKAKEITALLRPHMMIFYDESGAIGRRYRRQDEIGTPFGITVDFETLGEKGDELKDTVTLRHRDSMKQERVAIKDLLGIILPQL